MLALCILGHSINSSLVSWQVFAHGCHKSQLCKYVVYFLTTRWYNLPWLIVVPFIAWPLTDRFVRSLNALGSVTEATCPADSTDRNFTSERHNVCMKGRTVLQKYSVWVEASDKRTWRTRTIPGFKIRSLNSRWHSKYHSCFLQSGALFSFFQKLQGSLCSVSGCKTVEPYGGVLFPTL